MKLKVLAIFLGGLFLVVVGYAGWDVYLFATGGTEGTISYSAALMGPFGCFVFAYLIGGLTWGLANHFWLRKGTFPVPFLIGMMASFLWQLEVYARTPAPPSQFIWFAIGYLSGALTWGIAAYSLERMQPDPPEVG